MTPSQKARGLLAEEIRQCRGIRHLHPELDIPRFFLRTRKIQSRPLTFREAETTYLYTGGFTIIAAFCDDSCARAHGIDLGYLVFNGESTHPCCIRKSEPTDGDLIESYGSLIDSLIVCKINNYQKSVTDAYKSQYSKKRRKSAIKAANILSEPKRRR